MEKNFGPNRRPDDVTNKSLEDARKAGEQQLTGVPTFKKYGELSDGLLETKQWVCSRCGRLNPCSVDCVQCQETRIEGNFDVHQEGRIGENRDAASINHLITDQDDD